MKKVILLELILNQKTSSSKQSSIKNLNYMIQQKVLSGCSYYNTLASFLEDEKLDKAFELFVQN